MESGQSRGHSERCSSNRYPASWEGMGCVLGVSTQLCVCASASVFFIANSPEQLQAGNAGAHGNTYSPSVLAARAWLSAQRRAQILGQSTSLERTNSATHPAVILQAGASNGGFCPVIVNSMKVRFSKGSVPLGFALCWQSKRKRLKLKLFRPMFSSGNFFLFVLG